MWRWLSILLISLPLLKSHEAGATKPRPEPTASARESTEVNTSAGPTSPEESKLLLSAGIEDFEAARYGLAIAKFQRFVDRYPGQPGYLEAHLWLGRARIADGDPAGALPALRYYTDGERGIRARAFGRRVLARAYLLAERPREALSTCQEIERAGLLPKPGPEHADAEASDLVTETYLIKTRALLALGRDAEARAALTNAQKLDPWRPALRGESAELELRLKLQACAKLSTPGPLGEDQARDQLDRRGTCLSEALLPFRAALETGDAGTVATALASTQSAWTALARACEAPPPPPENLANGKHRTPEQLAQYRKELRQALAPDCAAKIAGAASILAGWKYPAAEPVLSHLQKLKLKK